MTLSRPRALLFPLLLLSLLATACSSSFEHNGLLLGAPFAEVQGKLTDLRAPVRIEGASDKLGDQQLVRIPENDPAVAYEFYRFEEDKLTGIVIAYTPEADVTALQQGYEAQLGTPDARIAGVLVTWISSERMATFGRFDKTKSIRFFFEPRSEEEEEDAGEEPLVVAAASTFMIRQKASGRYQLLGLGLAMVLCAGAATLYMLLDLQRVRKATPAIRTRSDLDAYRRIGFTHKILNVASSVFILLGGAVATGGLLMGKLSLVDVAILIMSFTAYGGLGKSYMGLGKGITEHLPVDDPELEPEWREWLAVMNAPFAVANAKRLTGEATTF